MYGLILSLRLDISGLMVVNVDIDDDNDVATYMHACIAGRGKKFSWPAYNDSDNDRGSNVEEDEEEEQMKEHTQEVDNEAL